MSQPLLSLQDVSRVFIVRGGLLGAVSGEVRAVNHVSLDVAGGETIGLVGESGCGKTTLGRIMVRLIEPSEGTVLLDGRPVSEAAPGRLQMIFQDPFSSLNPRLPIGFSVAEPLRARNVDKAERKARTEEMLRLVGLDPEYGRRFPHEFSGGQRQRIAIARALITHPDVIVCDEAVSALDASIQAQILNLLADMRDRFSLTYVFVSHDLDVVGHMSDRVAVMYLGQIVELASRDGLFEQPAHPYTRGLLAAAPMRDPTRRGRSKTLSGELPSPLNPPAGCTFHPRCPEVMEICRRIAPRAAFPQKGHMARCHLYT